MRARLVEDGYPSVEVAVDGRTPEPLLLAEKVRVTRLAVIDATGDGRPDLVVWIDPSSGETTTSPRSQFVFRVDRDGEVLRFEQDYWTEAALGVVADDAALRERVPKLHAFAPPDETTASELLVLEMRYATAEQLRSLVAPTGLDVCEESSGNALPHGKRCKHYTKAHITDAFFADELKKKLMMGDPSDTPMPGVKRCKPARGGELCAQETGGPADLEFLFDGKGSARRLREINFNVYESS